MKVYVGKEGGSYTSSLCRSSFLVWTNGKWFQQVLKENKYPECGFPFSFFFPFKNTLQKVKISIIFLAW